MFCKVQPFNFVRYKRLLTVSAAAPPISVLTDSYKAGHFLQYPKANKLVAYGEFRSGYDKDQQDTRLVTYGMRYIINNWVNYQWTMEDVDLAAKFFRSHLAPFYGQYPWPEELFRKFVKENNGYFPVRIQCLPEGTCIHAHVPIYQIIAEDEYAPLCTFLETILTHVWYPCTVATLGRRVRDIVEDAFERGATNGKDNVLIDSRVHDFGFRGCTCVEQSIIGGVAHLLNFNGTDTLSAAYYAQFNLNNGEPVGSSIPATEHSVMTSWNDEEQAIDNMINQFGDGLFATVMDSYDYQNALQEIVPKCFPKLQKKGGFWVLRPDSGDPVQCVIQALQAIERVATPQINEKGMKVFPNMGVIQGDGINYTSLKKVLDSSMAAGYSPEGIAFGMGAGLLQKLNRDTMSFATKLCSITYADGRQRDIMKMPVGDSGKISIPGQLAVKRINGVPMVFPHKDVQDKENLLQVVYDKGPVESYVWESFSEIQQRVKHEWHALPKTHDVLSPEIKSNITKILKQFGREPPSR